MASDSVSEGIGACSCFGSSSAAISRQPHASMSLHWLTLAMSFSLSERAAFA